jgi:hypothetical protein
MDEKKKIAIRLERMLTLNGEYFNEKKVATFVDEISRRRFPLYAIIGGIDALVGHEGNLSIGRLNKAICDQMPAPEVGDLVEDKRAVESFIARVKLLKQKHGTNWWKFYNNQTQGGENNVR